MSWIFLVWISLVWIFWPNLNSVKCFFPCTSLDIIFSCLSGMGISAHYPFTLTKSHFQFWCLWKPDFSLGWLLQSKIFYGRGGATVEPRLFASSPMWRSLFPTFSSPTTYCSDYHHHASHHHPWQLVTHRTVWAALEGRSLKIARQLIQSGEASEQFLETLSLLPWAAAAWLN